MTDGNFLTLINGQIVFINILAPAGSAWHCKYEFVAGPDWQILNGLEAGLSQTGHVITNGEKIVLNLPIEIVYKSTNPFGWPQIVLCLYRGLQLEGYGRVHMPVQPGLHTLDVPLSRPQSSSFLGYIGELFGYKPELLDPKMIVSTAGNYLLRMVSNGEIRISVNIVFRGLQSLGYDTGANK